MQLHAAAGKRGMPGARVPGAVPAATQNAPETHAAASGVASADSSHAPLAVAASMPSLVGAGHPPWMALQFAMQQQLQAWNAAAAAAAASMPAPAAAAAAASMPAPSMMPTAASAAGPNGADKGAPGTVATEVSPPVQSQDELNKSRATAPIFKKVTAAACTTSPRSLVMSSLSLQHLRHLSASSRRLGI